MENVLPFLTRFFPTLIRSPRVTKVVEKGLFFLTVALIPIHVIFPPSIPANDQIIRLTVYFILDSSLFLFLLDFESMLSVF